MPQLLNALFSRAIPPAEKNKALQARGKFLSRHMLPPPVIRQGGSFVKRRMWGGSRPEAFRPDATYEHLCCFAHLRTVTSTEMPMYPAQLIEVDKIWLYRFCLSQIAPSQMWTLKTMKRKADAPIERQLLFCSLPTRGFFNCFSSISYRQAPPFSTANARISPPALLLSQQTGNKRLKYIYCLATLFSFGKEGQCFYYTKNIFYKH